MKQKSLLFITFILLFFATACGGKTEVEKTLIETVRDSITVPESVTDYELPTLKDEVVIAWFSDVEGTLTSDYKFIQGNLDVDVNLTASFTYDSKMITKRFETKILALPDVNSDEGLVIAALDAISFDSTRLINNIELPTNHNTVAISWTSDNNAYLSNTGNVNRPEAGEGNATVTLTATFTLNNEIQTRDYIFTINEKLETVVYEGYYTGSEGLEGDALKAFLHDLIDDHTQISYTQLWTALTDSDEDPNNPNNVILLYSGRSQSKTEIQSGNNNQDYWNREHVWAKSHGGFSTSDIEGTDMHHIRPTDVSVNANRGNLDFDLTTGSLVSDTDDCYIDSDSFEPRDEVKGDVARMIFYMVVRYEGDSGELDLELNNSVSNSGPYMGKLSVLLQWHLEDAPDTFEMHRNDVIYSQYQHNRNPFIDHPEFAMLIWG